MQPGCVLYLVNHTDKDIRDFHRSLALLRLNYLKSFPCPVVAFHEKALDAPARARISKETQVSITWVEVDLSVPGWIDNTRICGEARVGYCSMCRFFTKQVFEHPALEDFEYHLRLDTDSEILAPVKLNLFTYAQQHNKFYGYVDDTIHDQPQFLTGLRECCQGVVDLSGVDFGCVYYTNCELCWRPWFRLPGRLALIDKIDQSGINYYHRVGDAPIRYIEINTMMPKENRWVLPIHYRHQVFTYRRGPA